MDAGQAGKYTSTMFTRGYVTEKGALKSLQEFPKKIGEGEGISFVLRNYEALLDYKLSLQKFILSRTTIAPALLTAPALDREASSMYYTCYMALHIMSEDIEK